MCFCTVWNHRHTTHACTHARTLISCIWPYFNEKFFLYQAGGVKWFAALLSANKEKYNNKSLKRPLLLSLCCLGSLFKAKFSTAATEERCFVLHGSVIIERYTAVFQRQQSLFPTPTLKWQLTVLHSLISVLFLFSFFHKDFQSHGWKDMVVSFVGLRLLVCIHAFTCFTNKLLSPPQKCIFSSCCQIV